MSHFTVLVIGDNPEEQLKPFQENNMGDCPKEYLAFHDTEDDYRKEYEEDGVEMVRCPDGSLAYTWDDRFKVRGERPFDTKNVIPEGQGYEKVTVPHKQRFATFEDFMKEWVGYDARDIEKGRYGYWKNPNAKWDWYSLGGRWNGFFKLKTGAKGTAGNAAWGCDPARKGWADQAKKKDIDFDTMIADAVVRAEERWDKMLAEQAEAEFGGTYVTPEMANRALFWIGAEPGMTKTEYLNNARKNACTTFAVLKDGVWYERGDMGWWGCVSNEKKGCNWNDEFMALFDEIENNELISVFDCHI